jgi:SpoVK/Ycf46/Vps4 family AAA+-type ATPase
MNKEDQKSKTREEEFFKALVHNLPSTVSIQKFSSLSNSICNRRIYPVLETQHVSKYSNIMSKLDGILSNYYEKVDNCIALLNSSCSLIVDINSHLSSSSDLFEDDSSISALLNKHSSMSKRANKELLMKGLNATVSSLVQFVDAYVDLYKHSQKDFHNIYEIYKWIKINSPNKNISIDGNRILSAYLYDCLKLVPAIGVDDIELLKFKRYTLLEIADPHFLEITTNPNTVVESYAKLSIMFEDIFADFLGKAVLPLFNNIAMIYQKSSFSKNELERIINSGGITSITNNFLAVDFNKLNEDNSKDEELDNKEKVKLALIEELHDILLTYSPESFSEQRITDLIEAVGKVNIETSQINPDNFFYVGSTGEVGALELVREKAPNVTFDDIIGESFNEMKEHLTDLTNYSEHNNLYISTSPRKKIKSNMIAIGPYGCGKTEIARAIASDERFVGIEISVSDLLTAYFGEFEKNVDRLWDQAMEIRKSTGKIVFIIMDEFDSFFGGKGQFESNHSRVQKIIQAKLDGITDYEGIIVIGMTNEPKTIPLAIFRRFKYVDVVGQLNVNERIILLKKFITRGLPLSSKFKESHWKKWAEVLEGVTGDIIGKIADDIHYDYMSKLIAENPKKSKELEAIGTKVRMGTIPLEELKNELSKFKLIEVNEVDEVINSKIKEPVIQEQIKLAVKLYKDADSILNNMHKKDAAI